MKKIATISISILELAGGNFLLAHPSSKNQRPNIIYIMSDDHAYQMISAYDSTLIKTPNIDGIARSGLVLRNNFVSNSISGPCRAAVLTGKFSHINGFKENTDVFDGSQQTFPKLLQNAGYETAVIGKWHLGSEPTGFDYYCVHVGQGTYYSPVMIEPDGRHTYEGAYATELTLDKSLEWLDKQDGKSPFCLMMQFKAPHRNWIPAVDKMNLYENKEFPIPDTFYDDYSGRVAAARQEMSISKDLNIGYDLKVLKEYNIKKKGGLNSELSRMTDGQREAFYNLYKPIAKNFFSREFSDKELAEWKYQRYMKDYSKVISSVDDMVGKLVKYLSDHDLLDNTIIIYTSDQGFYMGEHGWFDKRFMYEESMRTPFIISYPEGIDARGDVFALTQNIDIAPTLLEYAGVDIPDDIQGESMVPLFSGKKKKIHDGLYYHYYQYPASHSVHRHYGIRTDRYKLIHFYGEIDEWELYDLKNDPHELNNIANLAEYSGILKKMKKELQRLQEKYQDNSF